MVTTAPPTRALREISTREITISITPDDHFKCPYLFAENSRASGGSAPWAPGRGSRPLHPAKGTKPGPWTPPV